RANVIGQIDLVDEQQVGIRLRRATLARDLLATSDVDDVDGVVHQLGTERSREVVAARLDQEDLQGAEGGLQILDRVQVDRDVVTHCRMRTGTRFDASNALGRQRSGPNQEVSILTRVDVIRDYRHVEGAAQPLAQGVDERGLARTYRAPDTEANCAQDRNNRAN